MNTVLTTGGGEPHTSLLIISIALVLIGVFFLFTGTYGILVLPDVYNRIHATSKATTLGASSLFVADFVYFSFSGDISSGFRALVGILFLFLTVPTGAHMISRSAQRMGVDFYGEAEWPDRDKDE